MQIYKAMQNLARVYFAPHQAIEYMTFKAIDEASISSYVERCNVRGTIDNLIPYRNRTAGATYMLRELHQFVPEKRTSEPIEIALTEELHEFARVYFAAHQAVMYMTRRPDKSIEYIREHNVKEIVAKLEAYGGRYSGAKYMLNELYTLAPILKNTTVTKKRMTPFETEATSIAALGRNELKTRIRNFKGRFKLDFTEEYLNKLSVDRLRHILLAAVMNARRR